MSIDQVIISSFLVTILTETGIILTIQKYKNIIKWSFFVVLINSLTQPVAIYMIQILDISYFVTEILVIVVETVFYKYICDIKWKTAIMYSLVANVLSILLGVIFRGFQK